MSQTSMFTWVLFPTKKHWAMHHSKQQKYVEMEIFKQMLVRLMHKKLVSSKACWIKACQPVVHSAIIQIRLLFTLKYPWQHFQRDCVSTGKWQGLCSHGWKKKQIKLISRQWNASGTT